jgi:hypothetical protein
VPPAKVCEANVSASTAMSAILPTIPRVIP